MMEIKPWATHRRLPEDDPTLSGLAADLTALYQVFPPREIPPCLAVGLQQRRPKTEGAIPLSSHVRTHQFRPGGARRLLTQGIAATLFIVVLVLVSGALTFGIREAATSRPTFGANNSASGIPKGAKIKLTIDNFVQTHIVEPTLATLIRQNKAVSGSIIVERPSDGAIIAMDSQPNPDSRTWQQIAASNSFGTFPNPASSDAFTPGQTVKPLITGIGFDTGSFDERTKVTSTDPFKTDGVTIQEWCYDQCGFGGSETVTDMLDYSSNIAATLFAKLIPDQRFYQYLDNFGFGRRQTGSGLPNANPGLLIEPYTAVPGKKVANNSWRPAYRDLTAFGEGVPITPLRPGQAVGKASLPGGADRQVITATPLQLANAYAALANGGTLMQPHLVQSYSLSGKTTVVQPTVLDVVFQHKGTAQRVTNTLVKAQSAGEACEALVPGYDVAAKTGDAVLYNSAPPNSNPVVVYAVAYGPVGETDPARRFVVLIELKDPNNQWGSETAAPMVSVILQALFKRHGLQPDPKHIQPNQPCLGPNSPAQLK